MLSPINKEERMKRLSKTKSTFFIFAFAVSTICSGQVHADSTKGAVKAMDSVHDAVSVLSGPTEDCDSVQITPVVTDELGLKVGLDPVSQGARKLLATMFQSCDALNSESTLQVVDGEVKQGPIKGVMNYANGKQRTRRITDKEEYILTHPVLSQLKAKNESGLFPPAGESCKDPLTHPPVYGYGTKTYENDNNQLDFTDPVLGLGAEKLDGDIKPSAIDCSGLVVAALMSQGLKVQPNRPSDNSVFQHSTGMFRDTANANSNQTCINHARFMGQDSIKTGDIINLGGAHIVMVDAIGDDPLGINAAVAANSCNDITIDDFDFSYIHSGALSGSNAANMGPSRVHISFHTRVQTVPVGASKPGTMFNNLVALAKKRCDELSRNQNVTESSTYGKSNNSNFGLLRHVINDNRDAITADMKNNCQMESPLPMEGYNCIDENCI